MATEFPVYRKTSTDLEFVMFMPATVPWPRIGEALNLTERGEGMLRIIDIEWAELPGQRGRFQATLFCEQTS